MFQFHPNVLRLIARYADRGIFKMYLFMGGKETTYR